jgi:mRNA-degrading endonuclease RelE of RelBE toxin-antitoxin system
MYRVFRSGKYEQKLNKLDKSELDRIINLEQSLKIEPYNGKPLGYEFFREKKLNGKRLIFLVYEQQKCVFLVTITNKKLQQIEINFIKANLDIYKEEIERRIKGL